MGVLSEGLKGARALLDMSRRARMERAREMGFDTERVLYHGTRSDIDELRPSAGGEYGRGVYLSESPDTAAQFAAYAKGDAGQNIIPVYVRTRSPLVTESRDEARRLGPSGLRRKGFDSVEGTNPVSGEKQTVVLDPSDIRSVNAAFDPAKRDSSNLLAGVGAAAVGAGLLAPQEADAAPFGTLAKQIGKRTREAWHGSPHVYDQVDLSRMGTGEGAQAYGAGYYAADARNVAEGYAKNVQNNARIDEINAEMRGLVPTMDAGSVPGGYRQFRNDDAGRAASAAAQRYDELMDERTRLIRDPGSLYRLEIPDENLLDWDAPLSEQPWFRPVDEVVAEYQAAGKKPDAYARLISKANAAKDQTGRQFYEDQLAQFGGDQSRVSAFMNEAGIPGIRYLDGVSRNAGDGTRNYVIFDDANVNVVERNGEPIAAMPRGREKPMSAAAGFARPGMMAAAGAGGAIAYDPVEARQTARRKREIDELTDTLIRDWQRSVAAPRPETPRFETLAQLSEWARAQRTQGIPLYEQPLQTTADTLDRLAYGEYRRGREGLGTLAADAVMTAAEVFDPGTWAALGRQKQQDLINRITSARERANR